VIQFFLSDISEEEVRSEFHKNSEGCSCTGGSDDLNSVQHASVQHANWVRWDLFCSSLWDPDFQRWRLGVEASSDIVCRILSGWFKYRKNGVRLQSGNSNISSCWLGDWALCRIIPSIH
jgi:hypothetical protein